MVDLGENYENHLNLSYFKTIYSFIYYESQNIVKSRDGDREWGQEFGDWDWILGMGIWIGYWGLGFENKDWELEWGIEMKIMIWNYD